MITHIGSENLIHRSYLHPPQTGLGLRLGRKK